MTSGVRPALISVAGLIVRFEANLEGELAFELPPSFLPFEIPERRCDVTVVVSSAAEIPPLSGRRLRPCGVNWRILENDSGRVFEIFHPPSGTIYCRARASKDFRDWDVLLRGESSRVAMPHPLDQLLWIPPLGQVGGVFLHACGAVVGGRAFVFAGHSGDGKTTLAGLLEEEGLPILSDERVAIRREGGGYRAYGTPWAGEGDKVSTASHPLGALFVLRKAEDHRIVGAPRHVLAGEIVARSIVPYYLEDVAGEVLTNLARLLCEVPLYRLDFALAPGIARILAEAFR